MKNNKKLICLGPQGSYAQIAAQKVIDLMNLGEIELLFASSITKVIEEVEKNADYIGVVPIENSIEGIVRETVDTLLRVPENIQIFGEVVIPISHCLISKAKDISEIKNIISYTQGIAQCHRYIANNLPEDVKTHTSSSTSEAVKSLKELDFSYAAIGTSIAAQIYGFNILDQDINDEKDNKTRFICIDRIKTAPTGNDKTSIAFSATNTPGSLFNVLKILKERNINMSYIESRPSKRSLGEYTFFIDFDGHIIDEQINEALSEIAPCVHFFRHLGSYPKCPIS